MGELFRRCRPETALAWTGERLVTNVGGVIEGEHLHRYFIARDLCRGKRVLDIASGEGYGSALLAQTASEVIGVEMDAAAVEHAAHIYRAPNLQYRLGEATHIPLEDGTMDAVVSFETLEHFQDHESFFREVSRVLQPDGFLILSTPDVDVYSRAGATPNPYHVRELTREDFVCSLRTMFRNVGLFRQRTMVGSAILPDAVPPGEHVQSTDSLVYEQRSSDTFEAHRYLARAPYLVALASNGSLPSVGPSLYLQDSEPGAIPQETLEEIARLQAVEAEAAKQSGLLVEMTESIGRADAELQRLQPIEAEMNRLRPFEEEANRLQHLQDELNRLRPIEVELNRLQVLEAERLEVRVPDESIKAENLALLQERDNLQRELDVVNRQLETAGMLARQQSLVVRRLQFNLHVQLQAALEAGNSERKLKEICRMARSESASALNRYRIVAAELTGVRKELEKQGELCARTDFERNAVVDQLRAEASELQAVKKALQRQTQLSEELAGLIIPVWLRRLVPNGLRNSARGVKRSVGSRVQDPS